VIFSKLTGRMEKYVVKKFVVRIMCILICIGITMSMPACSSESKNDDIVRTFVDDEEMLEAAKRFYFKLPGIAEYSNLPSNTGSVGDTGSTDSTDSALV
jgi:hypothetical protein